MTVPNTLTIWFDRSLPSSVRTQLAESVAPHRVVDAASNAGTAAHPAAVAHTSADATAALADADIALGQPPVDAILASPRLKWVHVTSAGYTRYDTDAFRKAFGGRGGILTNSSWVYGEPCAEHLLAMMMALARQLPVAWAEQAGPHGWNSGAVRARSRLLLGQSAIILGFGAIGQRIAELLGPLHMNLVAIRRRPQSGAGPIRVEGVERLDELLPTADHVLNALPANAASDRLVSAHRIGLMKRGAIFYNVGRGSTVDQAALLEALRSGHLAAAYLDVTDPEPLPPDHPLWSAPNCYITPHSAGGHMTEPQRILEHFLSNLRRYEHGQDMADRVI
jgi:phosphoglycerate dehydrogenase-like enzyme